MTNAEKSQKSPNKDDNPTEGTAIIKIDDFEENSDIQRTRALLNRANQMLIDLTAAFEQERARFRDLERRRSELHDAIERLHGEIQREADVFDSVSITIENVEEQNGSGLPELTNGEDADVDANEVVAQPLSSGQINAENYVAEAFEKFNMNLESQIAFDNISPPVEPTLLASYEHEVGTKGLGPEELSEALGKLCSSSASKSNTLRTGFHAPTYNYKSRILNRGNSHSTQAFFDELQLLRNEMLNGRSMDKENGEQKKKAQTADLAESKVFNLELAVSEGFDNWRQQNATIGEDDNLLLKLKESVVSAEADETKPNAEETVNAKIFKADKDEIQKDHA